MWGRALRNDFSAMKFLRFQGNSRILRKMRKTECPTRAAGWVPTIHRRIQLIRLLRVRQMHNPSVLEPFRRPIPPGPSYPYSPLPAESDGLFFPLGERACNAEHGGKGGSACYPVQHKAACSAGRARLRPGRFFGTRQERCRNNLFARPRRSAVPPDQSERQDGSEGTAW